MKYRLQKPLELTRRISHDINRFEETSGHWLDLSDTDLELYFEPVVSSDISTQIREIVEPLQEHPSTETKREFALQSGLSNNAAFRALQQKQLDVAVAALEKLLQGENCG